MKRLLQVVWVRRVLSLLPRLSLGSKNRDLLFIGTRKIHTKEPGKLFKTLPVQLPMETLFLLIHKH